MRQPDPTPRPRPAHAGPPADERPPARAPRPRTWRLRPRTVRARIVSLLMVPVVSLIGLWAFATVTTAQDVDTLTRLKQVDNGLITPVDSTLAAVQAERTAALAYLAAPGADRLQQLGARAHATDAAIAAMHDGIQRSAGATADLTPTLDGRLTQLDRATAGLADLRTRISHRSLGWPAAMTGYQQVVAAGFGVVGSLTAVHDTALASDARVLLELSQAREMLAREDAAVQSAQAAGRMSQAQWAEFTGARYAQRAFADTAAPDLRPADLSAWQQVTQGQDATALAALEDRVRDAGPGTAAVRTLPADRWTSLVGSVQQQFTAVTSAAGAEAAAAADPYGQGLLTRNGAAVLFGLVAVVVSLVISVRIGRGLVGELLGLRNSALELAGSRLPGAMRRLRAGEEIDIDAEAPVVEAGDDEIGQVGEALNTVQRAALQAAVERAEVLSGVSGVFVNLARRSQVLVHRQLTLLDQMERRTEDPTELEDLFRLDHLTTRMRRHAEGLIILSGAAPGRAWRRPVPLLDVVRSAVAEVEDYARVEVRRLPRVAVVGAAVADLTHLIAELVENATAFSPPHTRVLVTGEQVGTGYAIEIEDRGLGMGKEAIAEANRRIADAQQADLFDSDRLGLFVVSRLARRHDVKVSLRTSAYGGTTAVLLLPHAVLDTGRAALPGSTVAEDRSESVDPSFGPSFRAQFAAQDVPLPPVSAPSRLAQGAAPVAVPTPVAVAVAEPDAEPVPFSESPPVVQPSVVPPPVQAVAQPAVPPPPPFRPATPLHPAATAGEELPRRVRQASLAVQLRDIPDVDPPAPRGDVAERNPEEVRATMTALAEGWARGRGGGAPRHLRLQQREHEAPQD